LIIENILATFLNAVLPPENDESLKTKMATIGHLWPELSDLAFDGHLWHEKG
jgi:hypothetical protein